ncbi:hypothetical protein Bca52824_050033 [Brassica carinata]|uniref:Uncharacterized protein n=1 Tax=Brassica carinata TaxID=52824 RepID=A0A8X7UTM5_BRACI|nr:hypothetical protein Bca52824_050033 [Brassica carinata]
MAVAPLDSQESLWESVTSLIRSAQEKNVDPLQWALELRLTLSAAGISLPSPDLAHLLVSHIFWENHTPLSWKLLEKAITVTIVPPLLVLALLSHRVIPNRKHHPAAYRLYLELLKRHAFSLMPLIRGSGYHRTMNSIDDILHLSEIFGLPNHEPGSILLAFVFSIVWQLVDASLDDEGLLELTSNKSSNWPHDMEIDGLLKRNDNHGLLEKANTEMAITLIQFLLQNEVTSRILHLASQNMPTHWEDFSQRFRVLTTKSLLVRNSKHINPEALTYLASHTSKFLERESKTIPRGEFHALLSSGSILALTSQHHGTSGSALWLPIDLFFEDIMDGTQAAAASAVENLTGLVKALQAVNSTTWHDAFLALWLAALRLVQRERDPIEGPVPLRTLFFVYCYPSSTCCCQHH